MKEIIRITLLLLMAFSVHAQNPLNVAGCVEVMLQYAINPDGSRNLEPK